MKQGVIPSRNPTMQAAEQMDALIQKSDFLCWQTLASSFSFFYFFFSFRSESDSFPRRDQGNPPLCRPGAPPCSGWQGWRLPRAPSGWCCTDRAEKHRREPSHTLQRLQLCTSSSRVLHRGSSSQQLQIRVRFILHLLLSHS